MGRVEIHTLDNPDPAKEAGFSERLLGGAAALVRKRPVNLGTFQGHVHGLLGLYLTLGKPPEECLRAARVVAELSAGLFLRGNVDGSARVSFPLGGETLDIPGGAHL